MREKNSTIMTYRLAIAAIYTGLGEYDKAFEILEEAYEKRVYDLPTIVFRPEFKDLRSDERYKSLVKKIGLPE